MITRTGPRRRPTLVGRVAVLGTVAAAFWVIAVTVAFNLLVEARVGSEVDALGQARAETVAATVWVDDAGALRVLPGEDTALDANAWIFDGGALVEGAPGGPAPDDLAQLLGHGEVLVDRELPSSTRYAAVPVVDGARQAGTVTAAAPSPRTLRSAAIRSSRTRRSPVSPSPGPTWCCASPWSARSTRSRR